MNTSSCTCRYSSSSRSSEEWHHVQRETHPTVDLAGTPLEPILLHIGGIPLFTSDSATICAALEVMPYDLKRRLLRDLNVQVLVSRPRSRAERAEHGFTPLSERVVVRIGELELHLSAAAQVESVPTVALSMVSSV